ncbi:hypothetical protein N665_0158s0012 [Sinapis alba]|nr:hypothetical protein N665_0158s0012 [Sinapis alba]
MTVYKSSTNRGYGLSFQAHFGFENLVTVDPNGARGGLALYYNNEFQVKVLHSSNQMIDVEAVAIGKKIFMTFVYGDPVQKQREQVWERLTRYGLVRSDPWFIIGDLNEIRGNHEKDGGALRDAGSFLSFNNMIRNSALLEFPARGNQLSWQGRRGKVMVRCRLDRSLANEDWHTLFPCSYTEYLGMISSDHRPVVAYLENKAPKRRGQFRFDKRWVSQEGFLESIDRGWGLMSEGSNGDFHALTKQRRANNRILGLYDTEGNWVVEEKGVPKVAVDYFDELFKTTSPTDFEGFLEEVIPSITPQMNQRLLRNATEDEVHRALFMMHPRKSDMMP